MSNQQDDPQSAVDNIRDALNSPNVSSPESDRTSLPDFDVTAGQDIASRDEHPLGSNPAFSEGEEWVNQPPSTGAEQPTIREDDV